MNSLHGLYFPEPMVGQRLAGEFLAFFQTLSFYQPIEDDPDWQAGQFFEAGLCKNLHPVPLGDKRENFVRFIKDFKGHEAEYYLGWLSGLSAGVGKKKQEPTILQLISTLQGKGPGAGADNEKDEKKLWQARLVLALCGILQREEEDISRGMRIAAQKGNELLRALKGDDEDADDDMDRAAAEIAQTMAGAGRGAGGQQIDSGHLLAAWGQIYLRDPAGVTMVPVTTSAVADRLLDVCETDGGSLPVALGSLTLPDFFADRDGTGNLTHLQQFRAQSRQCVAPIVQLLDRARAADLGPPAIEALGAEFKSLASAWHTQLDTLAGLKRHELVFYLLPGRSFADMIGRLARFLGDKAPSVPVNGLLAVLREIGS